LHLALFLILSIYWGCSAPLTKLLGVPEHLQPPPSYAYDLLSMAEITSGSGFEPNKPKEQKLGYVLEL